MDNLFDTSIDVSKYYMEVITHVAENSYLIEISEVKAKSVSITENVSIEPLDSHIIDSYILLN